MSKKDKKKKKKSAWDHYGPVEINQNMLNDVADTFEKLVDIASRYLILQGVSYEEKEEAIHTIKKAVKKLRKGDPSAVFSPERYEEELERWKRENRIIVERSY